MEPTLISVHGGHSGQFCSHAENTLEEIVNAYVEKGFEWIGITEHMPPVHDRFIYPEERKAGFTVESLKQRFDEYMVQARRLQEDFKSKIGILVGFETETCTGCFDSIRKLIDKYQPDYIVGGVHHVMDISFDYSSQDYGRVVKKAGNIEALYCIYFDLQYELLQRVQPAVVAHFDLIRIFDPDYQHNFQRPAVEKRIWRNLEYIAESDLILDLNVAALRKGASEPYVSRSILKHACELGIRVMPGDDSHGIATVGAFVPEAIELIREMGCDVNWRKPILHN
ncbi:MAG: histidinol-phosphatase [Desulfobacteraceae bacterium]|nr:histidinol-phosphatase [Desulfobacteraceae bacterium]